MKRDLHAELADIRRQREAALVEQAAVKRSPPTLDEIRERIETTVARMAAGWVPDLSSVIGTEVRMDTFGLLPILPQATLDNVDGMQWRGLLCTALGDAITAALVEKAAARLRTLPEGIAASDRAVALRDLDERLHELEVLEERTVRALEAGGDDVDRRPDAAPTVVLGTLEDANTRAA